MDEEFKQRANESAERMARAGMTLSAGIMQELIAEVERLGEESAAEAGYIRFLETELTRVQAGNSAVPEQAQELGEENPQRGELRLRYMVLAGEMNN
jgi:hypothetical protein